MDRPTSDQLTPTPITGILTPLLKRAEGEPSILIRLPLSEVRGEHPLIAQLERQHALPRPGCLPDGLFTLRGLIQAVEDHPLGALKVRDRYLCVSGLRLYRTLRQDLPASTVITVRVYRRLRRDQLSNLILRDLFISPGVVGFRPGDLRPCARLWQVLKQQPVFGNHFRMTGQEGFARLLGRNSRRLRGGDHA